MKKRKLIFAILMISLLVGMIDPNAFIKAEAANQTVLGENIIKNPNFDQSDMSMWLGNGAQLKTEKQDDEILPGVTTYGTVYDRTWSYQGFYQDVTASVKPGESYQITYYMKLSEDYEAEKTTGRKGFFGPYIVTAAGEQYLSQDYSGTISGDLSKSIPVGEWVCFSGTFTLPEDEEFTGVVVRFQEESSTCKGSYSITGVSMRKQTTEDILIQSDLPDWKDAITAALGEDTIAGLACTGGDLADKGSFQLLTKHANAFTFGNEMKPDFFFNYSNGSCPGKKTITFQGITMDVPVINFSRTDGYLNKIVKWNEEHPNDKLRVRGHTLLWHAQTPEWFFHVDYDPNKDYVTKDVMSLRMEWYIKTVLEHFTGEDSPYKDMFYGWDVLNEAANDGSSMAYRDDTGGSDKLTDSTHNSKSSWWHIYQSNEYIIEAFTYANKYAPETLELYYNDYGDSSPNKCNNICTILQDIKDHEGPRGEGTRISAMGMQAHYGMNDFSITNFESCARRYLDIVGAIQLTELDMNASSTYDGTINTRDEEYLKQALTFQKIFETLIKLNNEEGYRVSGITFWGTIDTTSWLQSKSDLGGGADGLRSQCPLMFDGNYQVKPTYWAFVDPEMILPIDRSLYAYKTGENAYKDGKEYEFSDDATSATIVPMWGPDGLNIQVTVKDKTLKDSDCVILYVDPSNAKKEGITPIKTVITRKEASSIGGGYKATFNVPVDDMQVGKSVLVDIVVMDDDKKVSFCDLKGTQENSSRFYATLYAAPELGRIHQGTITVDGQPEELWETAETWNLEIVDGAKAKAQVRLLWDSKQLYLLAEITDDQLYAGAKDGKGNDSLEIYIDEDNGRTATFSKDDKMYRINCENNVTMQGTHAKEKNITSAVEKTENGYRIEAGISWTDVKPKNHTNLGIEFRLIDADANGTVLGSLNWSDATGASLSAPSAFATVKLASEGKMPEKVEEESKEENHEGGESEMEEMPTVNPDNGRKLLFAIPVAVILIVGMVVLIMSRKKKTPEASASEETKEETQENKN